MRVTSPTTSKRCGVGDPLGLDAGSASLAEADSLERFYGYESTAKPCSKGRGERKGSEAAPLLG